MKLRPTIASARRRSAMMLIECLVYIAVFTVLTGIGLAAFYFCWDHTRATIYATDEVESALRAGEGWRADVRAATGKISVENTATGEVVTIPEGERMVVYRFAAGELHREIPAQNNSRVLLPKVKTSEMTTEARDGVTAWRWELAVTPRRKEAPLPLLFTFEAAQIKP
jgi:Tfp pilus assembly protein FimT